MAEIVLDANVLLRYLTDEPRALADRADRILKAAENLGLKPVVAPLTVAEVVFVLESVYRWSRRDIADRLLSLLAASVVEVLEVGIITRALTWYRDVRNVHFADAYIAALAASRNSLLASFDQDLKRLPGVKVAGRPEDLS